MKPESKTEVKTETAPAYIHPLVDESRWYYGPDDFKIVSPSGNELAGTVASMCYDITREVGKKWAVAVTTLCANVTPCNGKNDLDKWSLSLRKIDGYTMTFTRAALFANLELAKAIVNGADMVTRYFDELPAIVKDGKAKKTGKKELSFE